MQKRNERTPKFKKKVVLETIKEANTTNEIANKFGVHPVQVSRWKREFLERAEIVFERSRQKEDFQKKEAELHEQIGRLTVENTWLKKKLDL